MWNGSFNIHKVLFFMCVNHFRVHTEVIAMPNKRITTVSYCRFPSELHCFRLSFLHEHGSQLSYKFNFSRSCHSTFVEITEWWKSFYIPGNYRMMKWLWWLVCHCDRTAHNQFVQGRCLKFIALENWFTQLGYLECKIHGQVLWCEVTRTYFGIICKVSHSDYLKIKKTLSL